MLYLLLSLFWWSSYHLLLLRPCTTNRLISSHSKWNHIRTSDWQISNVPKFLNYHWKSSSRFLHMIRYYICSMRWAINLWFCFWVVLKSLIFQEFGICSLELHFYVLLVVVLVWIRQNFSSIQSWQVYTMVSGLCIITLGWVCFLYKALKEDNRDLQCLVLESHFAWSL